MFVDTPDKSTAGAAVREVAGIFVEVIMLDSIA
jgi:hypothetical protein